jgi:hypothetical protein
MAQTHQREEKMIMFFYKEKSNVSAMAPSVSDSKRRYRSIRFISSKKNAEHPEL